MNNVSLPLKYDKTFGSYEEISSIKEIIIQDLKNLLFTQKGELLYDPDFGVGLGGILFEHDLYDIQENLKREITNQLNRYMPFVIMERLDMNFDDNYNLLSGKFYYSIPEIQFSGDINLINGF